VPQKGGYGNPQKGIKGRVLNNPLWVSLTIMGDFRLKWFENATKKRRTRKGGYNRGKITATPFFVPAIITFVTNFI
ncbi:MAG: hypothetical protein LBE04_01780, partial [Prevotellaceae bacterium]|nr:hypothetical protein [Prevotellaceae bacterium]